MQAYLRTLGKIKSNNSFRNPGRRQAKHRVDNGAAKASVWGRSYPSES
jgi:hypothetical protein